VAGRLQGCQFGNFEARFFNLGFFWRTWLFFEIKNTSQNLDFSSVFQSERLGSGKTLSKLYIHYKSLLTGV